MTLQRQLILDTVKECYTHPNATEVYMLVKEKHSISLATVYNNLNYLADNGFIKRVAIAGEADRFDGNVSEHQHAVCNCCNKVYDVEVNGIREELERKYGLKVTSFGLNLHCICQKCLSE